VGINLPKIPLAAAAKGMVLADPGTLAGSRMFNAALHMRPRKGPALKNGQRVRLFIGTAAVQATAVLMGPGRLEPGRRGLVQLRLAQRLHAAARDAFVIAPLNQNQVLGGGLLLAPTRQKYRPAKHTAIVPFLEALDSRDVTACVDLLLEKNAHRLMTSRDLCAATGLALGALEAELNARVNRGELVYFKGRGAVKRTHYDRFCGDTLACVAFAMKSDPFHKGLAAGEIRDDLAPAMDPALLGALLTALVQSGRLEENGGRFRLPSAAARLDERRSRLLEEVSAIIAASDICPFSAAAVRQGCRISAEKAEVRQILNYLTRGGHLVRLSNGRYLTPAALETIKDRVRSAITARGRFKLSDSKAVLGYGRMGAVPVLDYLDQIGFTVRRDNERRLKEAARREPAIP
jgi:selenocysteine-specific elongation factor